MEISRRADFSEIPIIDIEPLGREDAEEAKVIAAIRDACEHVGFFYICNHGVPRHEMQNIFKACERFFSLPQAERDRIYLVNSPNYRGYLPIGVLGRNVDRPRDLLSPSMLVWNSVRMMWTSGRASHCTALINGLPICRPSVKRYSTIMA